jgi:thiamine-monophosphate kinase
MKISEIGEFGFLDRFSPDFKDKLPPGVKGIGDDCAVMPWRDGKSLLATTDMLVEGVHFFGDGISPQDLGYKSLAVNLSDIAAMGGKPLYAFLSLGMPGSTKINWLDQFFNGLHGLAEATDVFLLGGDTTKSPGPLIINICVLGAVATASAKFRSGALAGDVICVTGFLGDSAAGLKILLENKSEADEDAAYLLNCHRRPQPQLAEGTWLGSYNQVHAMIDVSDGIDSDLHRIMDQSRCGAVIELEQLPLSQSLRRIAANYQWDMFELAAAGGEDYCLLAAIDAISYPAISRKFEKQFGRPLFKIGKIADESVGKAYLLRNKHFKVHKSGFDHFKHGN